MNPLTLLQQADTAAATPPDSAPGLVSDTMTALLDTLQTVAIDTLVIATPETLAQRVSAWSTVAVAFLALVAISVEVYRERRRRREAGARISAVAYAAHRQLESWVDEAPEPLRSTPKEDEARLLYGGSGHQYPETREGIVRSLASWARGRQEHFDPAEARFERLMGEVPQAGEEVAQAVRQAYVLFYRATARMNRYGALDATPRPPCGDELVTAYVELKECMTSLESAIQQELRDADRARPIETEDT